MASLTGELNLLPEVKGGEFWNVISSLLALPRSANP